MSGFFTMHRSVLEHPLFEGDSARLGAWLWLVGNACWKPTRVKIKGSIVQLERGEMSYSVRFLAEAWGWSKSRVDRFLCDLRAENMIETRSKIGTDRGHKAGQGQSIISICNYSKYQDARDGSRDNSGTTSGTTAGQRRDKEEQGNKGPIEEERADALSSKRARTHAAQHPMPADWQPLQFEKRAAARGIVDGWPPGELQHQLEAFKAFHEAKASRFANWQQAWATWVLNSRNFGHGSRKSNHRTHNDNRDGLQRYLDEKLGIGEA